MEDSLDRQTIDLLNEEVNSQMASHSSSSPCPIASTSPASPNQVGSMNADIDVVGQKRKLTSVVWNHFKKLKVNGVDKAECNYCKKRLTGRSSDGTNHLHIHFKNCPRKNCRDIRQQILVKEQKKVDGSSVFLSNYHFDYDRSRMDLSCLVIVHEHPLSLVEHFWFKRYSEGLQPLFKVPSRHTVKRDIMKIYEAEKKKTMGLLDKIRSRIAITTDLWTASNQKKGFMAITSHFIDENWALQSRLLRYDSRLKTILQYAYELIMLF